MKKYICIGGRVICFDGNTHYISPRKLAELNGVNPTECYFASDNHSPVLLGLRRKEFRVLLPTHGLYRRPH